jgi:hypothetical protein
MSQSEVPALSTRSTRRNAEQTWGIVMPSDADHFPEPWPCPICGRQRLDHRNFAGGVKHPPFATQPDVIVLPISWVVGLVLTQRVGRELQWQNSGVLRTVRRNPAGRCPSSAPGWRLCARATTGWRSGTSSAGPRGG